MKISDSGNRPVIKGLSVTAHYSQFAIIQSMVTVNISNFIPIPVWFNFISSSFVSKSQPQIITAIADRACAIAISPSYRAASLIMIMEQQYLMLKHHCRAPCFLPAWCPAHCRAPCVLMRHGNVIQFTLQSSLELDCRFWVQKSKLGENHKYLDKKAAQITGQPENM